MKVAAYQAPIIVTRDFDLALNRLSETIRSCERAEVDLLCCPEAVLGGLADYSVEPERFAIHRKELEKVLAPLLNKRVLTIVGFTETTTTGKLYNSAAVLSKGEVAGVYRKVHPAINSSVYSPGSGHPVFRIDRIKFGILICNDSNFLEDAKILKQKGARIVCVPSNNGLPHDRQDLRAASLAAGQKLAKFHNVWVVRADVAGEAHGLASLGSTSVIDPDGEIRLSAEPFSEDLLSFDLPRNIV